MNTQWSTGEDQSPGPDPEDGLTCHHSGWEFLPVQLLHAEGGAGGVAYLGGGAVI